MADDTNFRSYRPADQRRPAQTTPTASGRQGGGDPLAELARLIGQTDPFSDLNQGAPRATPVPPRPAPVAIPQPPLRRPVATPSVPSDPYGSPLQFSPQQFDNRGAAEPQHESFQPAYDPAIYGTPEQQQAGGYPSDAYYDDPSRMPQGEEAYEEDYAEERPRHGIMKLAAVVVGLAVIGTGDQGQYSSEQGRPDAGCRSLQQADLRPRRRRLARRARRIARREADRGEG
jgi:hypothetical protein